MKSGCIVGYDLNCQYCQISIYDETRGEPVAKEKQQEEEGIPTILGCFDGQWVYGREAEELEKQGEGCFVSDLLSLALNRAKVRMEERDYDGIWLLAKFISLTLKEVSSIRFLTFTVQKVDIDVSKMLKGIGHSIGVAKENIFVEDYKESFCHYMYNQPKELWQYESALFYCDASEMKAQMLRRLKVGAGQEKGLFVTVDEVASARMEEISALSPFLDPEKAIDADERFRGFIENIFEKKVVSSVYLTGEGFEKNWYPHSLKVLCNGRRAFLGNNLYSKGACYHALRKVNRYDEGPSYLDETKMMEQISLKVRTKTGEVWYPIVPWGIHWYEGDGEWEVLLEDVSDVEILIETLSSSEKRIETVSLEGLPNRTDYSLRVRIELLFIEERVCKFIFRDAGFGEFFPPTDFYQEKVIQLGGSHEQFNPMS